ncbi:MAG: restriction endonuclease [Sciscionella sp.]
MARGKALEDLVQFVFSKVPSVKLYQRDARDEAGAQEVDLVFSHYPAISKIPISDITILIECKNEASPTSAADIREFGTKLRSRSLPIGVFVTTSGLAGTPGRSAHAAIRDELATGSAIIVVTSSELANFDSHNELVRLLMARLLELRTLRGYRSI